MLHVAKWKLEDEKIREEYIDVFRERVEEKGWQHLFVAAGEGNNRNIYAESQKGHVHLFQKKNIHSYYWR